MVFAIYFKEERASKLAEDLKSSVSHPPTRLSFAHQTIDCVGKLLNRPLTETKYLTPIGDDARKGVPKSPKLQGI